MTHRSNYSRNQHTRPFNTPLECGLRMLFILNETRSVEMDLHRLVAYDYLIVHSGDVAGGPLSLHPAVPHRGTELLVKRSVIQSGLNHMLSKELIRIVFATKGFLYEATELTSPFIKLMKSPYAESLRVRASWITGQFGNYTDQELEVFISENLGRWGAEFDSLTAIDSLEL